MAPRVNSAGTEQATRPGLLQSFIQSAAPEVVAATYWFDPPPEPTAQSVTLRFTGRRLAATGRPKAGDEFSHDEALTGIVAGSGPIAVTVKIRDVTPGEWAVRASLLPDQEHQIRRQGSHQRITEAFPAAWSWRHWRVTAGQVRPVRTRLAPFVPVPAVILGSWAALVILGTVLALVVQALVISTEGLPLSHVLTVSLLAVLAGAVGAKAWFVVLHRRDGRWDGWAVQGFVAGFALIAPLLLLVFRVPVGAFLDASSPGLMLGLAIGRLGCFFTGCCCGRPSASRWAVWSSNRSVGARRIPTQLMESALALTVGLIVLSAILRFGPQHGTFFVAAVAAYTLIRQGLLQLREERRQSNRGTSLVAIAAALALVVDLAVMVWG
jgi:phosphatidylglycerol:prolipoprotein diacylglycerol transferase